ncbi:hypothetical protein LEMA_P027100.1 [Plenodomus lingam JN3]|uniref:Uncharacterized protein n=1 Tax=Leptosphaeria maculans (strain JN3 / isolate v23.1.3 / race Av1-4-5-6-7-8) TaxID=985895 RepID=E4ZVD2_LEPMJ|nr:hypothetical protein LEMA_P027100.1 [Plenodomus lingam JN3]CBX95558.1 hypothetical protein LEMA_P027100.1 [Plenodomus lingam JN3]
MLLFGLGGLLTSVVLLINAIAILSEDRFLARIGWTNAVEPGFGGMRDDASIKARLINLVSSVRTLMRSLLPPASSTIFASQWAEDIQALKSACHYGSSLELISYWHTGFISISVCMLNIPATRLLESRTDTGTSSRGVFRFWTVFMISTEQDHIEIIGRHMADKSNSLDSLCA